MGIFDHFNNKKEKQYNEDRKSVQEEIGQETKKIHESGEVSQQMQERKNKLLEEEKFKKQREAEYEKEALARKEHTKESVLSAVSAIKSGKQIDINDEDLHHALGGNDVDLIMTLCNSLTFESIKNSIGLKELEIKGNDMYFDDEEDVSNNVFITKESEKPIKTQTFTIKSEHSDLRLSYQNDYYHAQMIYLKHVLQENGMPYDYLHLENGTEKISLPCRLLCPYYCNDVPNEYFSNFQNFKKVFNYSSIEVLSKNVEVLKYAYDTLQDKIKNTKDENEKVKLEQCEAKIRSLMTSVCLSAKKIVDDFNKNIDNENRKRCLEYKKSDDYQEVKGIWDNKATRDVIYKRLDEIIAPNPVHESGSGYSSSEIAALKKNVEHGWGSYDPGVSFLH
jgi:hypothetical protein